MKNKTIRDNSKSIAIIMSRYLSFIMIDYLRYSKSKLLQDEGINSKEADCIIKSLSHSLPTITLFIPYFNQKGFMFIVSLDINQTIFVDDIEEQNADDENNKITKKLYPYFNTGFSNYFHILFQFFIEQSERLLSPLFISKLLHELFEIVNNNSNTKITSSLLYDLIPSQQKIESISPLPKVNFDILYETPSNKRYLDQEQFQIGNIPILIDLRGFRISSDKKKKNKNSKAYKVIAHQLNDDKQFELPQTGKNIRVSFPLEILVYKEEDGKEKLEVGEAYIINFSPSKDEQHDYFVNNYEELQKEFDQFMSLSEHDNEITSLIFNQNENESNEKEEDLSYIYENEAETETQDNQELNEFTRFTSTFLQPKEKIKISRKDFNLFELKKIPTKVSFQPPPSSSSSINISEHILSLRCSIQLAYNDLAEKIMIYYSKSDEDSHDYEDDYWTISLPSTSSKLQNLFDQLIIRPAHSMSTKLKFNFINKILTNEKQGEPKIRLVINRFEQQRFFEQFDPKSRESSSNNSARPMIVQLMEQVDSNSIPLLKVHRRNPFRIDLVGEGAIDASGPGREIFSSLIVELMNEHIGVFTFNPNRRHKTKDTNQEDLIPDIIYNGKIYNELSSTKMYFDSFDRFTYAGALIAVCIVSEIPQQMKLAHLVWEYLSCEKVSIESIYEIDHDFHEIIKAAESLQKQLKEDEDHSSSSSISEDEFESKFMKTFEIKNSFDMVFPLVDNGSKKRVTKENLGEFIELAKNKRIYEFDIALKLLKAGFDMIMQYKNITSILTPSELKLFICGEPNCSVEQMKQLTVVNAPNEKMVKMFCNVIESFSLEERILFIKFSTGSQGLPALGMRWETDLQVTINSKEQFLADGKKLPESQTCFPQIYIPYFETEEELAKNLRVSINYSGIITDTGISENGIQQMT